MWYFSEWIIVSYTVFLLWKVCCMKVVYVLSWRFWCSESIIILIFDFANKKCRKCRSFPELSFSLTVTDVYSLQSKNSQNVSEPVTEIIYIVIQKYLEQAQDLVFNENVLLQTLGFDVAIDHPHTHVVRCCHLVRGKCLAVIALGRGKCRQQRYSYQGYLWKT